MKISELAFFTFFGAVVTYMVTMGTRDWLRKQRIVASLAARVQRNDEQFGRNYYREAKRADVAARVRRILAKNLKLSLDGLAPSDRLNEDLNAELPLNPQLFWDLETEFGIKTEFGTISGQEEMESLEKTLQRLVTFQDLVEYVESKIAEPLAETPRQEESEKPSRAYEFAIKCIPYLCIGGFVIGIAGGVLQIKWVSTLGIVMFLSGIAAWGFANGGESLRTMIRGLRVMSLKEIAARPSMLIFQTGLVLFFLSVGGLLLWAIVKTVLK